MRLCDRMWDLDEALPKIFTSLTADHEPQQLHDLTRACLEREVSPFVSSDCSQPKMTKTTGCRRRRLMSRRSGTKAFFFAVPCWLEADATCASSRHRCLSGKGKAVS